MLVEYGKSECRKVVSSKLLQKRRTWPVRVLGTASSGASDDRSGWTGTAVWIRSLGYAGVEDDDTLNVSDAILLSATRCLIGDQWSDWRSGLHLFNLNANRRLWPGYSTPLAVVMNVLRYACCLLAYEC